jgi:hypothetical protein
MTAWIFLQRSCPLNDEAESLLDEEAAIAQDLHSLLLLEDVAGQL